MGWWNEIRGLRILLVDDDAAVRDAATLVLEGSGCLLTCAASAEQALLHLRTGGFDVVISDYRLPGRDGLSLLGEVRRSHPSARTVLATGHGSPELFTRVAASQAADLCLDKPLSEAKLADALVGGR